VVSAEQLSEQAQVTDWPVRMLLVAATAAVIALALLALRRGWRNRAKRQDLSLPPVPAELLTGTDESPATEGSYIGTIEQGRLLERVVAGGARSRADVVVAPAGVLIAKHGDPPLFITRGAITGLSTSPGMLQRYFGRHGLLMIDWVWADKPVTTGVWFNDATDQAVVRATIERVHLEGVS
jgi:hypothetical protein